jgi:hypothetical protein
MRKRNPNPLKPRTLSEVHKIWLSTSMRTKSRWGLILAHIDKIGRDMMPNSHGRHVVYYRLPSNPETLYAYDVNVASMSWSASTKEVNNQTRAGKIALAVDGLAHKYGQELYDLYNHMQSEWDLMVKGKLWEMIEVKLREQVVYADFNEHKRILTIDIDGHTYFVSAQICTSGWISFTWEGRTYDPIYLK